MPRAKSHEPQTRELSNRLAFLHGHFSFRPDGMPERLVKYNYSPSCFCSLLECVVFAVSTHLIELERFDSGARSQLKLRQPPLSASAAGSAF